jgi:hypothetical protein
MYAKAFGLIVWIATIVVAGIKVKYPQIGGIAEDALTGAMAIGSSALLFTPAIQQKKD